VDRVSIERMCAGKEFQTGSTLHIATSPGGSSHGHKNVHTNLAKAGHAVLEICSRTDPRTRLSQYSVPPTRWNDKVNNVRRYRKGPRGKVASNTSWSGKEICNGRTQRSGWKV